jgi:hypothetical protein
LDINFGIAPNAKNKQ